MPEECSPVKYIMSSIFDTQAIFIGYVNRQRRRYTAGRPTVESATPLFASWESFYVIVGSSAGALTGLQFVVIRRWDAVTHLALRGSQKEG